MKILYFSPIPYADLKQRPQHLAEELSNFHEVWYIDPTVTGMRCLKKKDWNFKTYQYDVNPHLHIFRPNGLFAAHIKLQRFDPLHINTWLERLQLQKLVPDADIVWIGYEGCYRLVRTNIIFPRKKQPIPLLIYDKMDDNVALEQDHQIRYFLLHMRSKLENAADIIFVTSFIFYQELCKQHFFVRLIPNGVGFERRELLYTKFSLSLPASKRRFGYVGTISHWFDQELIFTLATVMPECEIILVGPTLIEKIKLPNIYYYGTVPKKQIPELIQYFDVCLYPFKSSAFLDTIDPVKIYEYLAMNKPVVAIDSLEMNKFRNYIYTYKSKNEFLFLCHQKVLRSPFSNEEELKTFFNENSWTQRCNLVLSSIYDYGEKK